MGTSPGCRHQRLRDAVLSHAGTADRESWSCYQYGLHADALCPGMGTDCLGDYARVGEFGGERVYFGECDLGRDEEGGKIRYSKGERSG